MTAAIIGFAEKKNTRHLADGEDTNTYLRDAVAGALKDSGIALSEVDGLGLISFSLEPDHAADVAWRLGMSLRWIDQATHGGASGVNMLGHAQRAIEAGDAKVIVVVAGDAPDRAAAAQRSRHYNRARRDNLTPIGYSGPNSLFAMLTQRQMKAFGLEREDYGRLVISQRAWAHQNPNAVYRDLMSMQEYLDAPLVADPLTRLDCPPTSAGASAYVLTSADRCPKDRAPVVIRAIRQCYNYDHQDGSGLRTGLSTVADELWNAAGVGPKDMDLANCYDDYPAMVYAQLNDLKLIPGEDMKRFAREKIADRSFPVNTSGGLLSAGQAGGAGGMLGTIEVIRQLQHRAGERQIPKARFGVATGYGQVLYRYGAASGAVVLERKS
jgi:acetyl-CoA acetyltransferase